MSADLDRLITDTARRMTDGAPSSAFRASVMTEIAARPAPLAWRRWLLAGGVAAVTTIVAAASLWPHAPVDFAADTSASAPTLAAGAAPALAAAPAAHEPIGPTSLTSPASPASPMTIDARADPTRAARAASPVQMIALPPTPRAESATPTTVAEGIELLTVTPVEVPERLSVGPLGGDPIVLHTIEPLRVVPLTVAAIGAATDDQQ